MVAKFADFQSTLIGGRVVWNKVPIEGSKAIIRDFLFVFLCFGLELWLWVNLFPGHDVFYYMKTNKIKI